MISLSNASLGALFGSLIDKVNVIKFHSKKVDIAASCIQTTFAGLASLSLIGTGPVGMTVAGGFIVLPICAKGVSYLTEKKRYNYPTIHRTANISDNLLRVAAKIINFIAAAKLFIRNCQDKFVLGIIFLGMRTVGLAYNMLHDLCDTLFCASLGHLSTPMFKARMMLSEYSITEKFQHIFLENKPMN